MFLDIPPSPQLDAVLVFILVLAFIAAINHLFLPERLQALPW